MNILVVDDHPIIRKQTISILNKDSKIDKVFRASNVMDAVQMVKIHTPEIVVLDFKLGNESGLDIIKKSKPYNPKCHYVVMSTSSKIENFQKALHYNIDGYILKKSTPNKLIKAIDNINNHKKYYDPKVLNQNCPD